MYKGILLSALILTLCFSGISSAVDYVWRDYDAANSNWATPGNWSGGPAGTIPGTADAVKIYPGMGANDPIINSNVGTVYRVDVGIRDAGIAELTILSGGSLTTSYLFRLGEYQNAAQNPVSTGVLNMNGGSLTANGSLGLQVGNRYTNGVINMNSGTIFAQKLTLPGSSVSSEGKIYLNGGVIEVGSGGLDFSTQQWNQSYGQIDITGGTLKVLGTVAETWYTTRPWIIAYGGTGTIIADTTTQSGYTLLTAVPEPATLALLAFGGLLIRKKK